MQQNRYVQIPDVITVHLGRMDADAPNITMPFVDYIKGCAGCLICPTWPENAQRANIYAITSLALHRVCTKWYRARGAAFDITASAEEDMPFNRHCCLFYNTNCLVDEMFNNYLTRLGSGEPLPARICRTRQAAGSGMLCQPEAVAMAAQGRSVYDILRKYYGEDIALAQNVPQQGERERFLGTPLMRGASGANIRAIKRQLNRIGRNYPALEPLSEQNPDFDAPCERAIRAFQYIFDLPVTGVLDKATWYKIKQTSAVIARREEDPFAQEAIMAAKPLPDTVTPKNPVTCDAVRGNDATGRSAMENAAQWADVRQRIVQGGEAADNTALNNLLPGDVAPDNAPVESPISDSDVRENAAQEGALPGGSGGVAQGTAPPKNPVTCDAVRGNDETGRSAMENAAQWADVRQRIVQGGEAADNTALNNLLPGDVAPDNAPVESPISDSDVRENAAQEGALPGGSGAVAQWDALRQRVQQRMQQRGDMSGSGMPGIVIPGNVIPGNTMPNIVIPGDTKINSVISDSGIEARSARSDATGDTALENAAQWNAAQAQPAESAAAGNTALENAAQWNATRAQMAESGPAGNIITDRGIAARAEQEGERPQIDRSETPQGYAAQWNAARQNLPPGSGLPASPVMEPTSPSDHLVRIGPSVSTALPSEGEGVDSGYAVEWLRRYYGI